jgi:hypothetical protein
MKRETAGNNGTSGVSRGRAARLLVMMLAGLASACDLGTTNVPPTTSSVVVHAVLNPSASTQLMLLERTLTGTLTIPDTTFDPNNPIATAGGIPVPGALAELIDSAGQIVTAAEGSGDSTGAGNGVYRFLLPGSQLHLGERYRLHVHTRDGDDLTAFTRVPRPEIASSGGLSRTFNRDHDTLVVAWKAVPFARAYALRIESPHGPFFLFTDSTTLRLVGGLRNLFSAELSRLFVPGFRQEIRVTAVDSNFYDYYRTNNDPFTGAGIISRVNGGLGLFGSVVTLNSGTLTVTADQTEPVEGRYRLTPFTQTSTTRATTITLYVESKSTRPDVPDALSGRYTSPMRNDGIIGELSGTTITFALLADQLVGDTVDVFSGELKGTTITGTYRKQGTTAVFVKQ